MRKGIILKYVCASFLLIFLLQHIIVLPQKTASAGISGSIIADQSIFEGNEINVTDWRYIENQGIKISKRVDNTKIIKFGGTSSENGMLYDVGNPLISRKKALLENQTDRLDVDLTLRLISIGQGKRFGFVFGLNALAGDAGDDGSYFLYFLNESGYKYGLCRYSDGEQIDIIAKTSLPSSIKTGLAATDFDVSLKLYGDGLMKVFLEGTQIYSQTLADNSYNGYLGITQIGAYSSSGNLINAELSSLNIYNVYYARPQTPAVLVEDFNDDGYDVNSWNFYSKGGMVIDGGKLHYDKAINGGGFSTRYVYSNFELTFTMSDFQNEPVEDANAHGGKRAATAWTAVSFGLDTGRTDMSLGDVIHNGYLILFNATINTATGERSGKTMIHVLDCWVYTANIEMPEKYDFYNWEDKDKKTIIRICVIDGVFELFARTEEEEDFTKIFDYALKNDLTPSGSIHFWCDNTPGEPYGWGCDQHTQSSIDDIMIVNKDVNPNTLELPPRVTSRIPETEDYQYIDTWDDADLLINKISGSGESGCGSGGEAAMMLIIAYAFKLIFMRRM